MLQKHIYSISAGLNYWKWNKINAEKNHLFHVRCADSYKFRNCNFRLIEIVQSRVNNDSYCPASYRPAESCDVYVRLSVYLFVYANCPRAYLRN